MKIVITGIGSIGRRHYANLASLGVRDFAVVRRRRVMDAPQREFFKKFKPKVFYDLNAALAEKPDAVFVCNPTSLHLLTARAAIRAGAHVFIEKPLLHTLAGVERLLAEAKRRKRIIYVGYHFRHHPLLKVAKRMLDAGVLGTLHMARFITGEYLPGWHPWEDYRKGYAARRDLGGGVVLTQSHDLDLIYWFFGKPRQVSANIHSGWTLGIAVDDTAAITFATPRCSIVTAHLDYLSRPPVKNFSISGSKGHLEWDYYAGTLRIVPASGKVRLLQTPRGFQRNDMYVAEIKDFIHCIRRGREPVCNGIAGRDVLEMALQAKESSRRRRMIRF